MSWSWERKLVQLGGTLVVTPTSYGTRVYFPGIDRRHNGTFWNMSGGEIDAYVAALDDAWGKFEQLAAVAPDGADMRATGKMHIGIHVASWPGRGITLHSHHSLISSRDRLDRLIEELRSLPAIAAQVQAALSETV
jgi:hypothetical protein